jgi:ArsR family transcriptional regulator, arsenate/arsenite/antimonite-responsive transcriptional repressor
MTIDIFSPMNTGTLNGLAAEEAVTRLKALADEKRLRIVELLAGGERCVCHLQEELDVAQPLLSFHLKKLKEAGLVTDRREGRWVHYSLDWGALHELRDFLGLTHVPPAGGPVAPGCRPETWPPQGSSPSTDGRNRA